MQRNKSNTEGMARSQQCTQNLCLCLCLCHMCVAMQAPRNKQNCTRSTLPAAEQAQQHVALQLWIPALPCVCLLVQSAALSPPSSDSVWAALSVCRRRCHQITQQLGAFTAQSSISLEDQRSHGRSTASFSPLPRLPLPPLVSTHFRCNVLHVGIARSRLSRVVARLGPTSKMAHLTLGAASLSLLTQS